MPHVIVKMLAGRTDELKKRLAEEITKVVMNITGNEEKLFRSVLKMLGTAIGLRKCISQTF
jgi:4-oxalocrotonate tautomerase family enzyme